MSTLIERRICLEPQYLDQNINHHLLEKIRKSVKNECTKEFGHILSVTRIIEIKDNLVSSANSDLVFTVVFEAETLKPDIGDVLEGIVCMILPSGIFLEIQGKLKVLIPRENTGDYTLNVASMYYSNDEKTIKRGDIIQICITGTKYTKQSFSCFGQLVSE